jgi:hypothetical protein
VGYARNGLTPIWTADNGVIADGTSGCTTGDSEIGELDTAVLVGEDVCTFDVSVDDTLIVKIYKSSQDLRDVNGDEIFGKFPEPFAYIRQGTILTEPSWAFRRYQK